MAKTEYQFADFLADVDDDYKSFVNQVHKMLLDDGYKVKIESKASGFFVAYAHPKTKRSLLNFLFRKKGLLVRIYGDNYGKYADLLNDLPENMVSQIDKAGVCKRFINPENCNSKCIGYDFYIQENHYQKCRYACFLFAVNAESMPFLLQLIESESKQRFAG